MLSFGPDDTFIDIVSVSDPTGSRDCRIPISKDFLQDPYEKPDSDLIDRISACALDRVLTSTKKDPAEA